MDSHFRQELSEELKDIDARLRVNTNVPNISRGLEKLFSLTSNYPKGDGDAFRAHIEEHHPDTLLTSAPSLKGNRQDVVIHCASAICTSRPC